MKCALQDKTRTIATKIRKEGIMINNKKYALMKLVKCSALHLQKPNCANLSRVVGRCNISLFLITRVSSLSESIEALPTLQHILCTRPNHP